MWRKWLIPGPLIVSMVFVLAIPSRIGRRRRLDHGVTPPVHARTEGHHVWTGREPVGDG